MVGKNVLNRVANITPKLKLYAQELLFFKTAFRDTLQMRNKDVRSEWRRGRRCHARSPSPSHACAASCFRTVPVMAAALPRPSGRSRHRSGVPTLRSSPPGVTQGT